MSDITAVFFDVGGVLLTNGWDHNSRKLAVETFHLDQDEFNALHEKYEDALDMGLISVNSYLDNVVFNKPREFSKTEFYEFMKSQSVPNNESIRIASSVSAQKRFLMAALNNESTDLNLYRIEKFKLGPIFHCFLSSCFLGLKKPDPAIYIRALLVANRRPEETLFIDDREGNLAVPQQLKMNTIKFDNAVQLASDLKSFGIEV